MSDGWHPAHLLGRVLSMKSDAHGILVKPKEMKIYWSSDHTWNMKLSQIGRPSQIDRNLYIATYSIPDLDYVVEVLAHRPTGRNVFLMAHSKFYSKAIQLLNHFRDLRIRLHPAMHSKFAIVEPETVFLGSANFGRSKWHETMIGIKDRTIAQSLYLNTWAPAWRESTPPS